MEEIAGMTFITMGVSGSGKTTLGSRLAEHLGCQFIDGDDLHPQENVRKMKNSIPLNDDDRWPWFAKLADTINTKSPNAGLIIACSALKRSYRDYLRAKSTGPLRFLFLDVPQTVILERLKKRDHHFMPIALLETQFATLEVLGEHEKDVLSISPDETIGAVMERICEPSIPD